MTSVTLRLDDRSIVARVDTHGHVHIDEHTFTVEAASPGVYVVANDVQRWHVAVADSGDARWISIDGVVYVAEIENPQARGGRRKSSSAGAMMAPMPATVVKVLVEAGADVAEGDTVLVLEAMKMELPIRAPRAGRVKAVRCTTGELVQPDVALVELED